MEYSDFDVQAIPGADGTYQVRILDSPGGQDAGTLRLPFELGALEGRIDALQKAILTRSATRGPTDSVGIDPVQQFGTELWRALFTEKVLAVFAASRARAESEHRGIRLKLRFGAPELAQLPWEYLFDQDRDLYLALSSSTPIVRYVEAAAPMEPVAVTPPLRILGLAVSPDDMEPLKVAAEQQQLERCLSGLVAKKLVEIHWVEGRTRRDLVHALRNGPWHIFHFIGHGGFDQTRGEGVLVLADEQGRSDWVAASEIGRLLGDEHELRLAVLNSCDGARGDKLDVFSSTSARIVRLGTPAVVAMQYAITDGAAREFSQSFYEAIADGVPVDAAVAAGRDGIAGEIAGSLEWGTPVLFTRAPDGVLFKTPAAVAETPRTLSERLREGLRDLRVLGAAALLVSIAAVAVLAALLGDQSKPIPSTPPAAGAAAIVPSVDVSAEDVKPGDTLTVTGNGFQGKEPVQFSLNGVLLGWERATAAGAVTKAFLIPQEVTRPGARMAAQEVYAEGRTSRLTARRLITVLPALVAVVPTVPIPQPSPTLPPMDTGTDTEPPFVGGGPGPTPEPTLIQLLPDFCIPGFVWREINPADHVCVVADERLQVAQDNQLAAGRIDPFGPYGADTCIVPYVWREAFPDDHVCVSPGERDRVALDNRLSDVRIAPTP